MLQNVSCGGWLTDADVSRWSTGFNATTSTQEAERRAILGELLGGLGEGSWVMPRFQCDYGYLITIGRNSFLNYDAILMDCAPITIGDDAVIGAGAVVTRDVPAKVFAAGNPCRVLKES